MSPSVCMSVGPLYAGSEQEWERRPFSLGPFSALSSVREVPSLFLSPADGPSRNDCSHHLTFLRAQSGETAPSSGITMSTLSGVSQLASSAGVTLILPTMRAQWQLVCEGSLTWRLGSNNSQASRWLGGKVQGQWREGMFCRLWSVTTPSS